MGQYGQGAYESWTPVLIFDPTTANMVLSSMDRYSALLLRERERALQEEKDFLKDYGDFYSSVPGATEAYYNEGVGKIQNAIALAQAAGIDLTRSIEGRNLLHRLIASVDVGKMNQLKLQKEAYDNYNKALDTLVLKGEITPEQAAWKRKNDGVDTFTALDGNKVNMFNGTVAGPMQDLNSFVDTVAGNIEKSFIKTEGGYDLSGVSGDRIRSVVGDTLNEYLNTDGGAYAFDQYMKAKGYDLDLLTEDLRKALRNDPNEIAEFGNFISNLASLKYESIDRKINPTSYIDTSSRSAGGYGSSSSSSNGGGSSVDGDNVEYGYSTQSRLFNEGVANLLLVPVEVTNNMLKSNTNALYDIAKNQQAVISKHTDENGNVGANNVLSDLSIKKSIGLVAQILGFTLNDDEDKKQNMYSFKKEELNNMITPSLLATKIMGFGKSISSKDSKHNFKTFVLKYNGYNRDEVKAIPTGHIVTYLDKDRSIKQYAKIHIMASKVDANGNEIRHDDDYVYIDLGTRSTLVGNKDKEGNRKPIAIDRNQSTLRDYEFETIDKSVSSDQTKSIKSAYNN